MALLCQLNLGVSNLNRKVMYFTKLVDLLIYILKVNTSLPISVPDMLTVLKSDYSKKIIIGKKAVSH